MRLLRHEAGHALDTAFRLRRRRRWREVFGRASRPYADSYRPNPGSHNFVQHLDAWYAQSHPTEDFAETFAVWLNPGSRWRHAYRDWPALRKLQYVDDLMDELRGRTAPVRSRRAVESLRDDRRTLADYYRTKLDRYAPMTAHMTDHHIRRAFAISPATARTMRAATLLRGLRPALLREVAAELGVSHYLIRQVVRLIVQRCEVLGLYVRGSMREARARALRLIRRVARLHRAGRAGEHVR
jgi:hypothetical protein